MYVFIQIEQLLVLDPASMISSRKSSTQLEEASQLIMVFPLQSTKE